MTVTCRRLTKVLTIICGTVCAVLTLSKESCAGEALVGRIGNTNKGKLLEKRTLFAEKQLAVLKAAVKVAECRKFHAEMNVRLRYISFRNAESALKDAQAKHSRLMGSSARRPGYISSDQADDVARNAKVREAQRDKAAAALKLAEAELALFERRLEFAQLCEQEATKELHELKSKP